MSVRNSRIKKGGLVLSESSKLRNENKKLKERIEALEQQFAIHDVSIAKRTFNRENELLQFIYLHTPFAVKPTSKTAKTKLVPTFTSRNAFEQVCKQLAKKLFNEC